MRLTDVTYNRRYVCLPIVWILELLRCCCLRFIWNWMSTTNAPQCKNANIANFVFRCVIRKERPMKYINLPMAMQFSHTHDIALLFHNFSHYSVSIKLKTANILEYKVSNNANMRKLNKHAFDILKTPLWNNLFLHLTTDVNCIFSLLRCWRWQHVHPDLCLETIRRRGYQGDGSQEARPGTDGRCYAGSRVVNHHHFTHRYEINVDVIAVATLKVICWTRKFKCIQTFNTYV